MDKIRGKRGMILILLLAVFFTAFLPAGRFSYAAENTAEVSLTEESSAGTENAGELRKMQESIINWKNSNSKGDKLLSGELLNGAGDGGSDWFAFDISRIGMEDNQAAYLSRLQNEVEKIYQDLEGNKSRHRLLDIYRIILTIEACGGDPTDFGKDPDGNPINLLKDGVWNSIWGDPGDQGINGYIWALLAIDSRPFEAPQDAEWTREKLITSLLSKQLADGGFGLLLTDASDVDLTAMVLTALAPYGNSETEYMFTSEVTGESVTTTVDMAAEEAFACISEMQHEDGSMVTYDQRTSESTSWALMALAAWGLEPETDERFIKNGNTLLDGLKNFHLPDGGMIHSLDGEEEETAGNNMAGYQALYALEAVCRLREGKCGVFDMSDAPEISKADIEKAGEDLSELTEETQKSGEEARADTQNRTILMTAGIAGAVVLIVIIFLILVLRDRKRKRQPGQEVSGMDDEDDDDW